MNMNFNKNIKYKLYKQVINKEIIIIDLINLF